jgi:ParB/RepB/Spo0J family partition protein
VFAQEEIEALAASIAADGLAQPITVRELADGRFEVVAGERRLRAHRHLGRETIPAMVRPLDDEKASAVMLLENSARVDLDPLDEARAYRSRVERFGWSVADCARAAGTSEVRVQFRLKLLNLTAANQELVRRGVLSLGQAQVVASSGLDANREAIVVARLAAHPSPSLAWLRAECSRLLEEQASEPMAFFAECAVAEAAPVEVVEPPHPSTHKAPRKGRTVREVLENQAAYWRTAAAEWAAIGKPFKRQEAEAAAAALESAAALV